MSHTTTDSEDMVGVKDQADSPSLEEGNSERSGRARTSLKKGPWTSAEDKILMDYIKRNGEGNWNSVQKNSGLFRCGKSCRLRWSNHLRPNLKKGSFTTEEEKLIVELHAKFGNKWARMAAHLPGRTDNEIKNFWNTRIKRHQRAGIPLYPADLCLQTLNESLQVQNPSEFNSQDAQHQGMQVNIPDVVFDHFKGNQGLLPYAPTLPDISVGRTMTQGCTASQRCSFMPLTMHHPKRLRASETIIPGFSCPGTSGLPQIEHFHKGAFQKLNSPSVLSFSYGPDPRGKNPTPVSAMPGSYAFSYENCYASQSLTGPLKLDLPSLQYPLGARNPSSQQPHPLDSVDAFIQSPSPPQSASLPVKLESPSPRNSGLLDALLYQAQNRSTSFIATPGSIVDNSTINAGETRWEEFAGHVSPFRGPATRGCNELTPASGGGSTDEQTHLQALPESYDNLNLDDYVAATTGGMMRTTSQSEPLNTASLLDMDWHALADASDDLLTLVGEDIFSDCRRTGAGTSTFGGGSNYKQMGEGTPTFFQGWGGNYFS